MNRFEVLARIENGTADISVGGIIATISGNGFANEVTWDGTIEIEDTYEMLKLGELLSMANMSDVVTAETTTPASRGITETMQAIQLNASITIGTMQESISTEWGTE